MSFIHSRVPFLHFFTSLPVIPGAFVVPSQVLHVLASVWNSRLQFRDGNNCLDDFEKLCVVVVVKLRRDVAEHRPNILTPNMVHCFLEFSAIYVLKKKLM